MLCAQNRAAWGAQGQTLTQSPRQLGRLRVAPLVITFGVAAVALAALLAAGHTQMPLFLLFTTCVLPLFQAATYPRAWPAAPLLAAALAAIWLWEGVRPLFVGLLLFQAVPVAQELASRLLVSWPRVRRLATISLWWAAATTTVPLVLLAFGAMYMPELLFGVLEPTKASAGDGERAFKAAWAARLGSFTRFLGAGRGPDDPWRVLGLAHGASVREVRKRARELSLVYHPDKTGGNNPIATARFLQIQAAAERLTRRDAADDATKAVLEAARDAATRCVECVFVVGIWIAVSALAAVSAAIWPQPQPVMPDAATLAAMQAAADGAAPAAPEVRVGPSFIGAGMLGLAPAAPVRGAVVGAPLPRVGSAAVAAAAEEAERRAVARRAGGAAQQQPPAAQAGPPTAAPVAPPRPGLLGAASALVFGKPKAVPERPLSGKERRAAKRADSSPAAPAVAVAEASHPKAA